MAQMQSNVPESTDLNFSDYQILNSSNYTNIDDCETNSICVWLYRTKDYVYFGIGSVYFTLALLSRGFLILGLYKAMLREPSYFFQMIFGFCDLIDALCLAFYVLMSAWLARLEAYTRCYWCVWIDCKFAVAAYDFGITNTLFMSLIMATDRLLSLAVPINYAKFSKKTIKVTAVICCVCLSILLNGFDWFMYIPQAYEDGTYDLLENLEFIGSLVGTVWVTVQNLFLVFGALILAVVNGFMLKLYRKRLEKLKTLTSDNYRASLRKRDEQALIVVTGFQCLFVFLNVLTTIIYYAYTSFANARCMCYYEVVAVTTDGLCMLVRLSDIYICVTANKRFRQLFLDGVKICNRSDLFVNSSATPQVIQ